MVVRRELPHIAVGKTADAINVLLVPDRPDPFRLKPIQQIRPYKRFRLLG